MKPRGRFREVLGRPHSSVTPAPDSHHRKSVIPKKDPLLYATHKGSKLFAYETATLLRFRA